jgi:DUF2911 family protein
MGIHRRSGAALALVSATALAGLAGVASAEPVKGPDVSPKATVSQALGMTDVSVVYHRPLVNKRDIWGKLVPYDAVWRAGANENTTITFTHPVTVEGQALAAGTYGLHMFPKKDEWTVIFSKNSTSWGSFSYDQKEDALRVNVKPAASEFHEALTYEFQDVKPDSAVLALKWEKLAVPVKIGIDLQKTTVESFKNQLRSTPGFTWEGAQSAADWLADNGGDLDQALKWADESLRNEERFESLQTKAKILRKQGKNAEADKAMAAALDKATPLQRHFYARQLLGAKKTDEAFTVFKSNFDKNPQLWFVKIGLARGYSAKGDYKLAAKYMKDTLGTGNVPDAQKTGVEGMVKRLESGQDIN